MRRTYECEAHVKQDIRRVLEELSILYSMPRGGPYAIVGVADFVCCYRGRYLEIEAKFGRNKQTEMQKAWEAKVEKHGGKYLVVDESNVGHLYAMLVELYASP